MNWLINLLLCGWIGIKGLRICCLALGLLYRAVVRRLCSPTNILMDVRCVFGLPSICLALGCGLPRLSFFGKIGCRISINPSAMSCLCIFRNFYRKMVFRWCRNDMLWIFIIRLRD